MKNNNVIGVLQDLGLTEYEAKTLIALFKFSESDAPAISRNAEIPKTRIYDVLEKLQAKGLVLEVYGRPKKFKAADPTEIFKNLINFKQKQLQDIGKRVDEVLQKENWSNNLSGSQEKILQVKDIKDYNKLISQELDSAQREICAFTHLDERHESLKNLKTRTDLNIKILTRPMTRVLSFPKHMNVKELDHSMDAFIVDGKKVILALNDVSSERKSYHLTVLENNPSLAKALMSHFNDFWERK